jgi:hypothetical protein
MNADDVQDLIPMVEILLKPMEKSEARELLFIINTLLLKTIIFLKQISFFYLINTLTLC